MGPMRAMAGMAGGRDASERFERIAVACSFQKEAVVIAHLVLYIPGDFVVMRASLLNVACRCRVHDLAVGTYVAATVALLGTVTAAAVLIQVRPWSYLFVARFPLTPCTRRSTRRATKACR
jgi:hypothetical protein